MTSEPSIQVAHDGPLTVLTIDRPKSLNALDRTTLEQMRDALVEVRARHETRCLIVTGGGDKAFVAGADIAEMSGMDEAAGREFGALGHAVMGGIEALPFPVIAAVHGFALGGGCELALACDFIYASTKAKFGQPEVKLGIIPGFGGTQRLLRRVPWGIARELVFSGRMLSADEALRIGLVNRVYDREALLPAAREAALEIANMGPRAVAAAKRLMQEGAEAPLPKALEQELDAFAGCFATADQKEGMRAFLDKRAAAFADRD